MFKFSGSMGRGFLHTIGAEAENSAVNFSGQGDTLVVCVLRLHAARGKLEGSEAAKDAKKEARPCRKGTSPLGSRDTHKHMTNHRHNKHE